MPWTKVQLKQLEAALADAIHTANYWEKERKRGRAILNIQPAHVAKLVELAGDLRRLRESMK